MYNEELTRFMTELEEHKKEHFDIKNYIGVEERNLKALRDRKTCLSDDRINFYEEKVTQT